MNATQERWRKELASANKLIDQRDALIYEDGEIIGFDPGAVPRGFADYYRGLASIGYANGWVA